MRRQRTGAESEEVPDPRSVNEARYRFGRDYKRADAALEEYYKRQANRLGHAVPGSPEERKGLDLIDSRREEERDREQRHEGRLVFSHIEQGTLIDYHEVIRGGRKFLIRVGP
jgi:hypothetical protein